MIANIQPAGLDLVIVSGSSFHQLKGCLQAVYESVSMPYQLLFVASRLDHDTLTFIHSIKAAKVLYDPSAQSRGKLRNLAIAASQSEYIAFIDDDTLPQEGWLEQLWRQIIADPLIGIVGSVSIHPVNRKVLQTGIELGKDHHPLYSNREAFFDYLQTEDVLLEPLAVSGNGMLLRRSALNRTGYFAETYHNEYEDVDLCLRMWASGFKVSLCTSSVLLHDESNRGELISDRRSNLELLDEAIQSNASVKALLEERTRDVEGLDDEEGPLVSILYPAFNDENFLEENIESILNQIYRNWELLIVNDASSDKTFEILERYKRAYPERIRIIHKSSHDRCEAWEMLYAVSQGKYLNILGADDVLLPHKLALQVQLLESHPSWSYVYGDSYKFDKFGTYLDYVHAEDYPPERQLLHLLKYNYISTPSVLMRKAAIEESGGWLKRPYLYAQDYDLWFRLLKGRAIGCIHRPLLKYRIHNAQLTAVAGENKMLGCCALVIQDKLKECKPEDFFPFSNLDSPGALKAIYGEMKDIFFSFFPMNFHLELEVLGLFNSFIDKQPSDPEVAELRKDFLLRVSYHFFKHRRYKLAASFLFKSLPISPVLTIKLLRALLGKVFNHPVYPVHSPK